MTRWAPISGFEGSYEVSSDGDVRRVGQTNPMKLFLTSGGYFIVSLSMGGRKKINKKVHRLVAETFLGKVQGRDCVNHKDLIKTNNRVENLEWVTAKENNRHFRRAVKEGLVPPPFDPRKREDGRRLMHKMTAAQISKAREMHHNGLSFVSISKALSIPRTTIWNAVRSAVVAHDADAQADRLGAVPLPAPSHQFTMVSA